MCNSNTDTLPFILLVESMPSSISCPIPTSLGFRCHLHLCTCTYFKLNCSLYAAMSNLLHLTAVCSGILTVLMCWCPCKLGKAVNLVADEPAQIDSGLDSESRSLPPLGPPTFPCRRSSNSRMACRRPSSSRMVCRACGIIPGS